MKVVINAQYGGFGLSKEGYARYCEIKGMPYWIEDDGKYASLGIFTCWLVPKEERVEDLPDGKWFEMSMEERVEHNKKHSAQTLYDRDIARDDPALVQLVEEDAEKYAGRHATLKVVEIPDNVQYEIAEYDGNEWVAEVHRTWS
jgi:hypothetical protein